MKDKDEDYTLFKQITLMVLWYEISWDETVTSPVKPRVILFWVEQYFKSFDHHHPLVTGTASSQKPCIVKEWLGRLQNHCQRYLQEKILLT